MREHNEKGVAMLVVIWALVLLIALGTEFATSMKTEVNATRNFKEDIESYHLARAGLAMAEAEILQAAKYHADNPEVGLIVGTRLAEAEEPTGRAPASGGEEVLEPPPLPLRNGIELGGGTVSYTIIDENRKIPINTASREVLVRALARSGLHREEDKEIIDTIADSILDWIDTDDNHRIHGAENEYYSRLDPPYVAHNGPIQALESLLKVRGMTPEIFYGPPGGGANAGFRRFFTTYNTGPVNPNTAERTVLSLVFDAQQVDEIMGNRAEFGYHNTTRSTYFRIVSTGRVANSATRHTLVALMEKVGSDEQPALVTHYWNDNFIDYDNDFHDRNRQDGHVPDPLR